MKFIERLVIINDEEVLTFKHIPFGLSVTPNRPLIIQINEPVNLRDATEMLERELLQKSLKVYPSYQAAKVLGVSQPTVIRKIQKYKGIKL